MKRPGLRVPSYRRHKPTGQAVVTIDGHDHYLGKHGAEASEQKYRRLIAAWLAGAEVNTPTEGITVAELAAKYQRHADRYYVKNGRPTSEVPAIRLALEYTVKLYGVSPAADFDVLALRAVREAMIDGGHCRSVVNKQVARVVRCFRWAVTERLYPGTMLAELQALPGLRRGRSRAHETAPIGPVEDAVVEATLPHLSPVMASMVKLQRCSGMRPGEIVIMRPCDVEAVGELWAYKPESHKTEHHGRTRTIFIGPRGQAILRPYLDRPATEYCFRSDRAAPVPRAIKRFRRDTYTQAVGRASRKAFPIPKGVEGIEADAWRRRYWWSPNQLRHSYGTEVRKQHGLEHAQCVLGHSNAKITEVYAERDMSKAMEAARANG